MCLVFNLKFFFLITGKQYEGIGDVCPLQNLHNESLKQVTQQITPVARALEGTKVCYFKVKVEITCSLQLWLGLLIYTLF